MEGRIRIRNKNNNKNKSKSDLSLAAALAAAARARAMRRIRVRRIRIRIIIIVRIRIRIRIIIGQSSPCLRARRPSPCFPALAGDSRTNSAGLHLPDVCLEELPHVVCVCKFFPCLSCAVFWTPFSSMLGRSVNRAG